MPGAASFPPPNGDARPAGHEAAGGAAGGAAAEYPAPESKGVSLRGVMAPPPAAAERATPAAGSDGWPAGPAVDSAGEAAVPEVAALAAPAGASRHRADPGAAARMFDAATTRRRSVVFEEDDELDVPDFLK